MWTYRGEILLRNMIIMKILGEKGTKVSEGKVTITRVERNQKWNPQNIQKQEWKKIECIENRKGRWNDEGGIRQQRRRHGEET